MMRLGTLTALDLTGVRPLRQADGAYHHACVDCGHAARTGNWYTRCGNPDCATQVFSSLDLVARKFQMSHPEAAEFTNAQLGREMVTKEMADHETGRRAVLDAWLAGCRGATHTFGLANKLNKLNSSGYLVMPGQLGSSVVTGATIRSLVSVALATGADVPDIMLQQPPEHAVAYVVQSVPHTIDRVVISTGVREWHLVWHLKRVGLVGLLGANDRQLVAPDYRSALALQRHLSDVGDPQEVAAIFVDRDGESVREPWRPDLHTLTAVVGGVSDIPTFAAFHEAFPLASEQVGAVHRNNLLGPARKGGDMPWVVMRRSYLAAAIDRGQRELTIEAINLLEQTSPSRAEVSWLVRWLRERNKLELSDAVKIHMDNRVIATDKRTKIRETASEYVMASGLSTSSITNFALQFTSNLLFRDAAGGAHFHAAQLVFGRSSVEILIGQSAIDSARELQKTIRHQLVMAGGTVAEQLPTIIDQPAFARYILPHFKKQIATLPSCEGFCNMGWSLDRALYVGPGIKVTLNGREHGQVVRHPGVTALRHFSPAVDWDVGFAEKLPAAARDLVAMILASCVRFYVKSVTRPVCVHHSPEARHLLKTMFAAIGQHEIFELNPNVRDHSGTQGVRGYPFLTTGYNAAQAHNAKFGHILLTDTGYTVAEEISQEDAEAAGRSLQYGLLRVVEWCLATGAEEFSEVPALHYNSSLLREGKWLVENVCKLQPWEVSDLGLAHLESLLAQIPATDTLRRLALKDGTTLTADLAGLEWDRDKVREDLRALRSRCEGEGDLLEMGAVEVLPAMELYYGRSPDVAVVF